MTELWSYAFSHGAKAHRIKVVPPGFLDRVCARGTLSSSAEGWSQETANSTPTMQIVGMWNPAEGTGYEPPGVIHPLDVLFIANGEEDMRRITELATTHMQRVLRPRP